MHSVNTWRAWASTSTPLHSSVWDCLWVHGLHPVSMESTSGCLIHSRRNIKTNEIKVHFFPVQSLTLHDTVSTFGTSRTIIHPKDKERFMKSAIVHVLLLTTHLQQIWHWASVWPISAPPHRYTWMDTFILAMTIARTLVITHSTWSKCGPKRSTHELSNYRFMLTMYRMIIQHKLFNMHKITDIELLKNSKFKVLIVIEPVECGYTNNESLRQSSEKC